MYNQSLNGLYIITPDNVFGTRTLIHKTEEALSNGVTLLQYRKKIIDRQWHEEANLLQKLCDKYNCLFIINDHVEAAKQLQADGVHIGQNDTSMYKAREILGSEKIIGVTCHNDWNAAIAACNSTADYVAFGAFHPSSTKPNAKPATIDTLRKARLKITQPIVAIGGITINNAMPLIENGANLLAISSAIYQAPDIAHQTNLFHAMLKKQHNLCNI